MASGLHFGLQPALPRFHAQMCGRYAIEMLDQEYVQYMRRIAGNFPPYPPRYNIAPQQLAPVIRVVEGETKWEELRWGFRPAWLKEKNKAQINSRAETILMSRMFKSSAVSKRCLVPASGWYEWQVRVGGKQPYYLHRKGGGIFTFAGIWTTWYAEDGVGESNFSIITTVANPVAAPVHSRMPAIIEEKDYAAWLDPANADASMLSEVLVPYRGDDLELRPVSTYVNSPKNIEPRCIEPFNA